MGKLITSNPTCQVESYVILLITSENNMMQYTIEENEGNINLKVDSIPMMGDDTVQIKATAFGGASLEAIISIKYL
jgi:hypothetical protein